MLRLPCHYPAVVLLALLAGPTPAADPLTKAEVAKIGKAGTALIDVKPFTTGSAFCVHPSGLFVTNDHVLQHLHLQGGAISIVVDAGQLTQQVLKATVVRRDKELDLALLRVAGEHKLPALALGSDEGLAELTELVAFGFPFGRAFAGGDGKRAEYPSVTVNVVNVSSLRNSPDRELHRIQLDSTLNPGNSGGPVLDRSGKVVGVVVSGVIGAGINMAIPVRHVRRFLERPDMTFTPPAIPRGAGDKPAEFRVSVMPIVTDTPVEVELSLTSPGGKERTNPMKREGGVYVAKAVPFPEPPPTPSVRLEVTYPDGKVTGMASDQEFKVGSRSANLSDVRLIRPAAGGVERNDGTRMPGAITGLAAVSVRLGGQPVKLDLDKATEVVVHPAPEQFAVRCVVVVRQGGREVGRMAQNLYPEGTVRATLASLKEGRFLRPPPAAGPTSYLKVQSNPGDYIGQGKAYEYDGKELTVQVMGDHVTVNAGGWRAQFAAPRGGVLKTGEYPNAKRYPFHDDSPGLDFSGEGRGSNQVGGQFVVWEFEVVGNKVSRLAIDFIHKSEIKGPGLVGMLRYNSSLE